jgi:hypothetical protein
MPTLINVTTLLRCLVAFLVLRALKNFVATLNENGNLTYSQADEKSLFFGR